MLKQFCIILKVEKYVGMHGFIFDKSCFFKPFEQVEGDGIHLLGSLANTAHLYRIW